MKALGLYILNFYNVIRGVSGSVSELIIIRGASSGLFGVLVCWGISFRLLFVGKMVSDVE